MKLETIDLKLIEQLSNAPGVSGFEEAAVSVAKDFAESFAAASTDSLQNLYIQPKKKSADKLTVLLDAHSDEVGFIVQAIRPNGMLDFLPVGGWVTHTVPAHLVNIRNDEGAYISGIVASKPPHFMSEQEKKTPLQMDQLVIDVGCTSAEEVKEKLKISIGAPVVPDVTFKFDDKLALLRGKAFDCRIGCAALLETMKHLCREGEDKFNLQGVISSQEEVGLRGIKAAMASIKADIAIVFEGCPADDSFTPEYLIQSGIKRGPMLRNFDVSMITNPRFQKFAAEVAAKYQLPMQQSVRKGGGNNGAVINLMERGVPTIVIGIPVRYAHTHYGYVALEDVVTAKTLAVKIIQELTPEIIKSF